MSRRLSCTIFSHLALVVATASCALNEPLVSTLNPATPDAGSGRPPTRPPVSSDSGAAGSDDAGSDPTLPPVDVPPTGGCTSGATRPCGPATEDGVCMLGTRVCVDSAWGDCIGAVMPGDRLCGDSADNDCDGQPDDVPAGDCECTPETTEPCDTHAGFDGVGLCKAGERTCIASADGKSSRWSACTGAVAPTAADSCTVKGDDSNCDGTPNGGCACVEGETVNCGPAREVGICKFGTSTCVNGVSTPCTGAVLPTTRNCAEATDNDCDGEPDNTNAACTCAVGAREACGGDEQFNGIGICKAGTRTCVAGNDGASSAFGTCTGAVSRGTRLCGDPNDNDCNGVLDNVIDASCACVPGVVQACGVAEGLDGVGRCRAGLQVCVPGANGATSTLSACEGAVGPLAADSCTVPGDDSNCDGTKNGGCPCVAGAGNGPCTSATASRCDATGACVACAVNADCSHLAGLAVCSAGACVQCLTDGQCAAGSTCNVTTHVCELAPPTPPVDAGG
ncbi:MAG TPA: hypothetical protein VMG12_02500 [Polyangiaceae bacterium]|nr:hypothetical protein [Polyangiaceae bacterium]